MDISKILKAVDHTALSQTATAQDIIDLCADAKKYGVASVCVSPCYVKLAKQELKRSGVAVCTVIGFPNGANTTKSKVFETKDAIQNGADEIDMVINIGMLKDKNYDGVLDEIKQIKSACGEKILKVIIETCLLTEDEKIKMCEIVSNSGADYIKTSTGFSTGGATKEDIALFAKHIAPHLKIKAAGGISSLQDAQDYLDLGTSRLGTSRIVKIVKKEGLQ